MRHIISSILILIGGLLCGIAISQIYINNIQDQPFNPLGNSLDDNSTIPFDQYSFPNLREYIPRASSIEVESVLDNNDTYEQLLVRYFSERKKITASLTRPFPFDAEKNYPVIIMLRGYVNPDIYQTGIGTQNAGRYFASQGFITIAPDFLGFGGSDMPHSNSLMARFERPVAVLNLVASLQSLPYLDLDNIFLWGHSNGGQIALSILEITGKSIPTTLWAPVSKGFPYSILYYTDQYSDGGKELRKVIADFETNHESSEYSIDEYWDWIDAPIQIHQGSLDNAVPINWSNDLSNTLKDLDMEVSYYTYEGADHNLQPYWNTVIQRDIEFFKKYHKIKL